MEVLHGLLLSVLLVACLTSPAAKACSLLPLSHGVHVHCTDPSLPSFPDVAAGEQVWLEMRHTGLTHLPHAAPMSLVQHLDVSHNIITSIDHNALLQACELRSLNVSHNHLTWLANDTFRGLTHLSTLSLQSNNLASMSSGMFRGLTSLTSLDLSNNHLKTLDNNVFVDLVSLTSLGLSNNILHHLEPLTFAGLNRLVTIDLSDNSLLSQSTALPAGVFAPLQSVETVYLTNNKAKSLREYPRAVFNDLVSVRHLHIDSNEDLSFGDDFAKMSSIQTVELYCVGFFHRLFNYTFNGFKNSSLQTLSVPGCSLEFVEKCAFCDLPHLKRLDLHSNNYLSPEVALLSLYGLQGQTMEEINFYSVGRLRRRYFTLNRKNSKYLRNICVKRLILSDCNLQVISHHALSDSPNTAFAKCIEEVDVSKNAIIGELLALLTFLRNLKNVVALHFQEQHLFTLTTSVCMASNMLHCGNRGQESPYNSEITFTLHPTLTLMNFSSAFNYFNPPPIKMHFEQAQGMKTLDVSYSTLSHCKTTFTGFENLETLDLSGNYCNKISDDLLDHLPSLTHLLMSNSHLTATDMRTRAQRILSKVKNLEMLDLSHNWLEELAGNSLPAQTHLKKLDLSSNNFQTLPVDVSFHPNLTDLDLSVNRITSLTSAERSSLDTTASQHPFRLQLQGNPLVCGCSNMEFLQWLWNTHVTLDGEGNSTRRYTCTLDTGEMTDTERVRADWQALWRRCLGQRLFGWSLAVFLLQLLSLLAAFMISRSWTYLKYAWNVIRRLSMPTRHDFRKDVYIGYADKDARLACLTLPKCLQGHGLRILLRHQEELPGNVKAEEICQFIDDSWKVILLVTRAFAEDGWASGFTVQRAQRAITDTLPNRVLVVFLEDPKRLPPMASLDRLLRHYSERNVLHVPPHTSVKHPVWDRLARAILQR